MRNNAKSACAKAVQFAEITKSLIRSGNVPRARKCLEAAEQLLKGSNAETRAAIENVYVYSLSTFMEIHKCTIANFFPPALRREYVSQINASGV